MHRDGTATGPATGRPVAACDLALLRRSQRLRLAFRVRLAVGTAGALAGPGSLASAGGRLRLPAAALGPPARSTLGRRRRTPKWQGGSGGRTRLSLQVTGRGPSPPAWAGARCGRTLVASRNRKATECNCRSPRPVADSSQGSEGQTAAQATASDGAGRPGRQWRTGPGPGPGVGAVTAVRHRVVGATGSRAHSHYRYTSLLVCQCSEFKYFQLARVFLLIRLGPRLVFLGCQGGGGGGGRTLNVQ